MNRDDIIRMAREAGFFCDADWITYGLPGFERFAALIEKHLSYDGIHTCHAECQRPACVAVREAVKAEREACAELCLETEPFYGVMFAEAIRARGEK